MAILSFFCAFRSPFFCTQCKRPTVSRIDAGVLPWLEEEKSAPHPDSLAAAAFLIGFKGSKFGKLYDCNLMSVLLLRVLSESEEKGENLPSQLAGILCRRPGRERVKERDGSMRLGVKIFLSLLLPTRYRLRLEEKLPGGLNNS